MKARIFAIAVAAAALSIGGCETMNGPEAQANAAAQRGECKVVSIDTTRQELRMQNQKGTDGRPIDQAEGQLGAGRVVLNNPKALREPTGRIDTLPARALRDC
jgi:hypothetical protein